MNGVVASVLTNLFGPPVPEPGPDTDSLAWFTWHANDPNNRSRLYVRTRSTPPSADLPDDLLACYGDFGGGSLIGTSMKMAAIDGRDVYGLYRIEELAAQPELREVHIARPDLCFFLDAANVWFYGVERGGLVAFDAELEEITELGEPATAFPGLLAEWVDSS